MVGTTDIDAYDSRRSTVYAPEGVVATSQPLASEAGLQVLRAGGNAFDAAVATAAALNVVEPMSTGIGGDAFMLYRTADGDVGGMQACGGAPAAATPERVRSALSEEGAGAEDVEIPLRSAHAVTVPGAARGWEATVEKFGRRTLTYNLSHAVRYAREGYPVSPIIANYWSGAESLLPEGADYLPGGRTPETGQTIRLPALGDTLATVAEEGADAFYEGEIADAIADTVQDRGGLLTVDDLADFEPTFVDPVSTTYGGAEIYELPPNNQGLIALEALNIAEELGAGEHPQGSPERVHYFAEAMKRAFHDGHRYITDPEYEEVPPLASKSWAQERAADVTGRASDVSYGVPDTHAEDADTVLLTVADSEGNVVSFINSLFHGFGSGIVADDTGVVLQNRGASFSLDPDHPNVVAPGKRPFHTLIPALADLGDDDWAAFGVMGGYMQPQGHVQVVSALVDDGVSVQDALDRPRWRYREDGTLAVEERLGVATKLARKGHDVRVLPANHFGGGQIARLEDGTLAAGTDPRKDGNATGY
jgi:gamma-glutamyltranspeptidase/glutathione hydrolase